MNYILNLIIEMKSFFMEAKALGLFILAFAEASFFPIPPDIVLIPLSIITPKRAIYFSIVTAVGSTLGGVFGYFIGVRAGRPILTRFIKSDNLEKMEDMFRHYGGWAVGIAGFTPLPYKLFTIASGVFRMNFTSFFIASFLSRSARFLIEGITCMVLGKNAYTYIDKLLGPTSFLIVAVVGLIYLLLNKNLIARFNLSKTPGFTFIKRKINLYIKKYGEFGIYLLAGFTICSIFSILFLEIVEDLLQKELQGFDSTIITWIEGFKGPTMDKMISFMNYLQRPSFWGPVLILIFVIIKRFFKNIRYLFMTIVAFVGSFYVQWGLKSFFHRPRMMNDVESLDFLVYSFPSGITVVFTAFFGYIVFLKLRNLKGNGKFLVVLFWLLFMFLVSISRIYMKISYPSDILGGFLIGGVWLAICIVATKALEHYNI